MEIVINTTFMLMNQVKGNLDKNLLDLNLFQVNLDRHSLTGVIKEAVDMLRLKGEMVGVSIEFLGI